MGLYKRGGGGCYKALLSTATRRCTVGSTPRSICVKKVRANQEVDPYLDIPYVSNAILTLLFLLVTTLGPQKRVLNYRSEQRLRHHCRI